MNFGILHLSRPETAMAESCRVLAPGGRFAFTQPPERLEAIREAMTEGVRRHADGDAFALPIVARVISARSPR